MSPVPPPLPPPPPPPLPPPHAHLGHLTLCPRAIPARPKTNQKQPQATLREGQHTRFLARTAIIIVVTFHPYRPYRQTGGTKIEYRKHARTNARVCARVYHFATKGYGLGFPASKTKTRHIICGTTAYLHNEQQKKKPKPSFTRRSARFPADVSEKHVSEKHRTAGTCRPAVGGKVTLCPRPRLVRRS